MQGRSYKISIPGLLLASCLLVACGTEEVPDRGRIANAAPIQVEEQPEEQPNAAEAKHELSEEEIAQLAAECSLNVHWYAQDGDFTAGTAFLMDSDLFGEKILVTAFHYLWPDDADSFTGEELPGYLLGGDIYYAQSGADTGADLKACLVIKDADAVPNIDKDVAAFTVSGGENLRTLKISDRDSIEKGEPLYILAYLWDTDDMHENCVYECEAVYMKNGELAFRIDPKYGLMGASGGPIVDRYGEVVAIVMASDARYSYGHSADSFMKQINGASISDIVYEQQ